MNRSLALTLVLFAGCATAPQTVDEGTPPSLPQEDFAVVTQSLTDVDVKYTGTITAGSAPITVQKAAWEFVVDGEIKRSGESQLNLQAAAGQPVQFSLSESLHYVKDEAELAAMDKKGGSLLLALRGKLFVTVPVAPTKDNPASSRVIELDFARSKEVRTPRLPHLKIMDFEAGRFSDGEVQAVFHLGVVNPNPFQISLNGIDFTVELSSKEVNKGTIGGGERVTQASTGVFDVTATLGESTHGKDAAKIIKGLVVPWKLHATLRAPLYEEQFDQAGEIKLTPQK